MSFSSLRQAVARSRSTRAKRARKSSRRTFRNRRLLCEPLEDRRLLSIGYGDFSDSTGLTLVRDAAIANGNILRLTPAVGSMEGAAWYSAEKQFVSVGWETTFDFNLNENADPPGGSDGFVFIVQNHDPNYLAGGGGTLGYNNLPNSLAVEFDTFQNSEVNDPSHSHISVHTNGTGPNSWDEALSLGSYDTPTIIDDAATHSAKISYTPGTLDIFLDDLGTPVLTVTVDLPQTLDLDAGRAWVGFTATTGGGYQNHDILSWQFTSQADTEPVINMGDGELTEGNSGQTELAVPVTVTRPDAAGDLSVSMTYKTVDGTATAPSDYVAVNNVPLTIDLANGEAEITQMLYFTVNGDDLEETHETFSVNLSNPVGAIIGDGSGTVTILNDDTSILIDDVTVTEGDETPRFIDDFIPAGSGGLDEPRNLASGFDGNIYVSSRSADSILRFDAATGAFIDTFVEPNSGGLDNPRGMVFHTDGNLYVASSATNSVLRYNGTTGAFIDAFVDPESGGLSAPRGLLFSSDGYLYVSSGGTDSILRYKASDGAFDREFVPPNSGGLDNPTGLAFGPDGHLYVASTASSSNAILRYDETSGAFIDAFVPGGSGGLDGPCHMIFRPDGLMYVTSWRSDSVLRYDSTNGEFVDAFVPNGSGGLDTPIDLLFDSSGNLYVSSMGTDEVLRYGAASQAVFTVSLSSAVSHDVSVDFYTGEVSASAGDDYSDTYEGELNTHTLTILAGETTRSIVVPTIDDVAIENDETFAVNLSNPTGGATVADGQGQATIIDDDQYEILVTPTSGLITTEYGLTAEFEVVLNRPPVTNVSIDLYSNSPSEGLISTAATGNPEVNLNLTFTPQDWDVPQTVTVTGVDDGVNDGDTPYTIVISAATSSDPNYAGFDPEDVSVTNFQFESIEIHVEAFIDGRDQLILQGDTLQWHHFDAIVVRSAPTIISTILNGHVVLSRLEWYPEWPDASGPTDPLQNVDTYSLAEDILAPALPSSSMDVALEIIESREGTEIIQTPLTANDYATIVEFNDNITGGAAWYKARLTFTEAMDPVLLAEDDFESGNFSGGEYQWESGSWTVSGDASIHTSGTHSGSYHARLRRGTGDLIRTVDTTGVSDVSLTFWSKLYSFESRDKAYVKVSSDGSTWSTVQTFVNGQDDNQYHEYQTDIADVQDTLYVRFDAAMSGSRDYWYIDDVQVTATGLDAPPSEPPVADAGAGEPYNADEGGSVLLDGSDSTDPEDAIVAWDWDLDHNGSYETSGVTAMFDAVGDGVFTVGLRVTDDAGLTDTDTTTVTVANVAPTANVGGPYSGDEGSDIALDGSLSSDPGNDIVSYE